MHAANAFIRSSALPSVGNPRG